MEEKKSEFLEGEILPPEESPSATAVPVPARPEPEDANHPPPSPRGLKEAGFSPEEEFDSSPPKMVLPETGGVLSGFGGSFDFTPPEADLAASGWTAIDDDNGLDSNDDAAAMDPLNDMAFWDED